MKLCEKNSELIKELIETGTFDEIKTFKCSNCENCEVLAEVGCDGLAWLDNILETGDDVFRVLAEIREAIEDENVSYGEIHYLQTHKEEVLKTGDMVLAQWADISEEQYNNGCLYNKDQLLEDLKTLNKVEQLQELVIDGTVYTITSVRYFEDEYDYDEDFDGKLNDFLKYHIDNDMLDELDLGGVCIMENPNNEWEEDQFMSFVEIATRYKGYTEIREHKTIISI